MSEKIDWDNLPTAIDTWKVTTKNLPEGLYGCPRCEGTGRVQVGHADPGPNPTVKCGMCNGVRAIKKCKECQVNPVPANSIMELCDECEGKKMQHILDLEKRPEIVCNFPQWITSCPHPVAQETNSDGNLVCDIDVCEYAIKKSTERGDESMEHESKTENIRRKHKRDFEEEERTHQFERHMEETKKVASGERIEEPCK